MAKWLWLSDQVFVLACAAWSRVPDLTATQVADLVDCWVGQMTLYQAAEALYDYGWDAATVSRYWRRLGLSELDRNVVKVLIELHEEEE